MKLDEAFTLLANTGEGPTYGALGSMKGQAMSTNHAQRERARAARRRRELALRRSSHAEEQSVMVRIGDEHYIVSEQVAEMRRTRRWKRSVRRFAILAWEG